jgi:hypothetical protein
MIINKDRYEETKKSPQKQGFNLMNLDNFHQIVSPIQLHDQEISNG